MPQVSLALVGFGNVGRAFARLLLEKKALLESQYGKSFIITAISTARHGCAVDPQGLDLSATLALAEGGGSLNALSKYPAPVSTLDFVKNVPADALLEISTVNHHDGQPALDYIRTALQRGLHVVTANKGPVVHGYHELTRLAHRQGRCFFFESAVMDGAPIFSLFRNTLPAVELQGFHGILNSTTNLILECMEKGQTFEQAVAHTQAIGVAEADPSEDVDGWDAAIKVSALSTVLMDVPLKPQDVKREGIRSITPQMVQEALQAGERYKLVCSCRRTPGGVQPEVAPRRVSKDSPMYQINGSSSYVEFETDVLPGLGIVETNPGTQTTAYGLLADLLNINC